MIVALYDVDSTIPNLALMKISAWHKSQGDSVEMFEPLFRFKYDKIYASKIFDFSSSALLDDKMEAGGTGFDKLKKLPAHIESMIPDYSVYNFPHSMGYAMRGCRMACSFCVVPQIEGRAYSNNSIAKIWTQRDSNFIILLDNDFFGNPDWEDCIKFINSNGLKVCFMQGLNIRSITAKQAEALASVKFSNKNKTARQVCFAWDSIKDEKQVIRGIKKCVEAGIKHYQMMFYVLIGYNSTEKDDLYRVETLRALGCDPFVMPFDKSEAYQRRFTRWVNHKAIFKSVAWRDYRSGTKPDKLSINQIELVF